MKREKTEKEICCLLRYEKKIQEIDDQLQLIENLLLEYTKNKHHSDINIELIKNIRDFMSPLYKKRESYIQIIYKKKEKFKGKIK